MNFFKNIEFQFYISDMVHKRSYSYKKICEIIGKIYGLSVLSEIKNDWITWDFHGIVRKLKWSSQDDMDYLKQKIELFEKQLEYDKKIPNYK